VAHAHHHDHGSALERAEKLCTERGERLTPMRAQVLELLAASPQPLGAYDLIEHISGEGGKRPAPITVYRALDFLLGQGLAHKIESRNAFVACDHHHGHADVVVFLLCEKCGAATEASGAEIGGLLADVAAKAGFSARGQFVEIAGECAACRRATAP
jgi:Fur family zinc uptake transcriptional regulator